MMYFCNSGFSKSKAQVYTCPMLPSWNFMNHSGCWMRNGLTSGADSIHGGAEVQHVIRQARVLVMLVRDGADLLHQLSRNLFIDDAVDDPVEDNAHSALVSFLNQNFEAGLPAELMDRVEIIVNGIVRAGGKRHQLDGIESHAANIIQFVNKRLGCRIGVKLELPAVEDTGSDLRLIKDGPLCPARAVVGGANVDLAPAPLKLFLRLGPVAFDQPEVVLPPSQFRARLHPRSQPGGIAKPESAGHHIHPLPDVLRLGISPEQERARLGGVS